MKRQEGHIPVLYEQTLDWLALFPGLTAVDGTLGGGGHAAGIIKRIMPGGVFVGIDRDAAAVDRTGERLKKYGSDVHIVHSNFKNLLSILDSLHLQTIDRALLDLGVSSYQLEDAERGFSYQQNAALDMRMDRSSELSAAKVVNDYPPEELTRVFREYGEEKWALRIAQFISEARQKHRIETTGELVDVVKRAIPAAARREGPHPAKRVFQAIRIEVNRELDDLGLALQDYVQALAPNGRLAVITFHSLEDRIVKKTFQKLADPCTCPPDLPVCVCGKTPSIRVLTRRPVTADEQELTENPRARSAKLRIAEKI